MSDNTEIQAANYSNEWIYWIEESISKNYIKYYEYKHFHNIEKIGNGSIHRANWKNSEQYFALKSFNFDNATIKEIIHEVITNCNNNDNYVSRFYNI